MPERTVEEIRKEIASERRGLEDDLVELRFRLRWLALVPVATALVIRRDPKAAIRAGVRAMLKLI
jgi:hypothetical protein